MSIVGKLRAALVHVDADDSALGMKILPEKLNRTTFFDADLIAELRQVNAV